MCRLADGAVCLTLVVQQNIQDEKQSKKETRSDVS